MERVRSNPRSTGLPRLGQVVGWPFRLRTSPIGLRVFLAYQVIIFFTALIGVLSVGRFNTLVARMTELDAHDLPVVVVIGRLRLSLFDLRRLQSNVGTTDPSQPTSDSPGVPAILDSIAADRLALLDLEETATASGLPRKGAAAVRDLVDGLASIRQLASRVSALAADGRTAEARVLADSQLLPLIQRNLALTEYLRRGELDEAAVNMANARQEAGNATRTVLLLTILSVIASAVLAVIITRSLVRPLSELLRATEAFAAGNLDASPRVLSRDELGRLARAFDTMRGALSRTITSVVSERKRTQAIIDATADGLVLVDSTRVIRQMNPAAERLSGWPAQSAVGHPCWDVFGCRGGSLAEAKEHDGHCPLLQIGVDATEIPTEIHARTRDGRRRWLAATCAPVPNEPGEDPLLVVGFRDISQLKAVDQMKSDFVAMVSHELRAPLTTVSGSVETLALLDHVRDSDDFKEVVTILQGQTQRLQRVIAEVLQLTRFEAGRLQIHLKAITLAPFLEELLNDVGQDGYGDERSIRLNVPVSNVAAWADPGLLVVVVRNLLDNARKYTSPGTPIEIDVTAPVASGTVQIRVRDHGPGIPSDQWETIFDRFTRGEAEASDTRGHGLGLYIARELMKALNGEIWVAANQGGACFVLSLVAATDQTTADETVR